MNTVINYVLVNGGVTLNNWEEGACFSSVNFKLRRMGDKMQLTKNESCQLFTNSQDHDSKRNTAAIELRRGNK